MAKNNHLGFSGLFTALDIKFTGALISLCIFFAICISTFFLYFGLRFRFKSMR